MIKRGEIRELRKPKKLRAESERRALGEQWPMFAAWLQGELQAWSGDPAERELVLQHAEPGTIPLLSLLRPQRPLALSNPVHFLRLRRLLGSAALALVVVGACALPDYTFETPGAGGTLGDTGVTGDITVTGSGGVTSTGSTSSEASVDTASATTTTGMGGSEGGGGSAGDNPGGSAGEGVNAGTDVGGADGTDGGTGGTGGSGGGGSGGGGTGGSTATTGSGGTGGSGQCNNDTQCLSKQCDDMLCRPEHCGSGELDGNETDVDCGGPDCRPCGYDQECQQAGDCATLLCSSQGRCESPLTLSCRCTDSGSCIQNPQSTLVDMVFQNTTNSRVDIENLTFHYFYSAEGSGVDDVTCISANFSNASCSIFEARVLTTEYEDATASHEVSFEYTQGFLAGNALSGSVQFSIHGNGPYQRANDYSFQEVPATMLAPCEFIVVTNADGVPIWGRLPE